jgi:hypothetical protein
VQRLVVLQNVEVELEKCAKENVKLKVDNVKLLDDFHQEQGKATEAEKKLADAPSIPPPPQVDFRQCKEDNERLQDEVKQLRDELKKTQDKTAGVQKSPDSTSPESADEVNSSTEDKEKMQGENTKLLDRQDASGSPGTGPNAPVRGRSPSLEHLNCAHVIDPPPALSLPLASMRSCVMSSSSSSGVRLTSRRDFGDSLHLENDSRSRG